MGLARNWEVLTFKMVVLGWDRLWGLLLTLIWWLWGWWRQQQSRWPRKIKTCLKEAHMLKHTSLLGCKDCAIWKWVQIKKHPCYMYLSFGVQGLCFHLAEHPREPALPDHLLRYLLLLSHSPIELQVPTTTKQSHAEEVLNVTSLGVPLKASTPHALVLTTKNFWAKYV